MSQRTASARPPDRSISATVSWIVPGSAPAEACGRRCGPRTRPSRPRRRARARGPCRCRATRRSPQLLDLRVLVPRLRPPLVPAPHDQVVALERAAVAPPESHQGSRLPRRRRDRLHARRVLPARPDPTARGTRGAPPRPAGPGRTGPRPRGRLHRSGRRRARRRSGCSRRSCRGTPSLPRAAPHRGRGSRRSTPNSPRRGARARTARADRAVSHIPSETITSAWSGVSTISTSETADVSAMNSPIRRPTYDSSTSRVARAATRGRRRSRRGTTARPPATRSGTGTCTRCASRPNRCS